MVTDDKADELTTLENDFQEIINELTDDPNLDRFRLEYEKIHTALKKSNASNSRLQNKCRELNAEIVANASKVAHALKLSQDDQTTVESLKAELDKAWRIVDGAHDKENRARETIQKLKTEIQHLTELIETGKAANSTKTEDERRLLAEQEAEMGSARELHEEVVLLREKMKSAEENYLRLEKENNEAHDVVNQLRDEVVKKQNDIIKEKKEQDRLRKEVEQAESETSELNKQIMQLEKKVTDQRQGSKDTDKLCREQKIDIEKKTRENKIIQERINKLKQEYDLQVFENEKLIQSVNESKKANQLKDVENNEIKTEIAKVKKQKDLVSRKLTTTEEMRSETEKNKENLKREIQRLEQEKDLAFKQAEMDKKQIEELIRERDLLNKNLIKAAGQNQKQLNLVRLHEQSKNNLEQEITQFRDEASKQRKIIYQLEKERDKYINEASELTQKVLQSMEDVKVREMQIFDSKKRIAESETRLKQQQNLYEACRADRNLYSKNLIEAQDEITEMKRKLKIMNHQIDQLKDEIAGKENMLAKTTLDFTKIQKEKISLTAEIDQMKKRQADSRSQLNDMEKETGRLHVIIREADQDRKRQQKELDQVITERDILGTQLVRRNDELALLYEKIKLQQATMQKGELQYTSRVDDIRVLKLEIKKLHREKNILNKHVSSIDELRKEIFHTQRELLRERTKCRALAEELENPMNVHRWRKLEGSDPASYELIQKVQALQKRLIEKTEDIVVKEMQVQEKEKMYIELRQILARQPGPELTEQLSEYKRSIKQKVKQMKRLTAELNMAESAQQAQDMDIQRLANELQEIKQKYLQAKKRERVQEEREFQNRPKIAPNVVDQARFTGGGFNLSKVAA